MEVMHLATLFTHIPNHTLASLSHQCRAGTKAGFGRYCFIMPKLPDLPSCTNVWFLGWDFPEGIRALSH
ncbi:MAG: hypothetical protein ACLQAH_18055 [Limisphaerales bacterium]